MDLQLAHRVAVIVGGARGIGAAIAREFAQEGCKVAVLDRDPAVHDFATELQTASKALVRAYRVDATDLASLHGAAAAIER
ncbi:MAG: SDR family NAD(P)-dependent oxidoreductase, partial [Planctomycetota bacterium]